MNTNELLRKIDAINTIQIEAADEENDYETAWLHRFDAGYSAALLDMLRWIAAGDDLVAKATAWADDYDHLLDEEDAA